MNIEKFYVSPDFNNNELVNVVIQSETSANISNITPLAGKVLFDTDSNSIALGDGDTFRRIGEVDGFGKIRVKLPEGSYYVNANTSNDVFTFEQGAGILIEPNMTTKSVLIKTSGFGNSSNNYSTIFGDGSSNTYTITHNLDSDDIIYSLKDLTDNVFFSTSVSVIDADSLEVSFFEPPSANSVEMVISRSAGKEGNIGATGPTGPQGARGFTGYTGPQGATGPQMTMATGTVNQTLRYNSSNVLVSTNVLTVNDGTDDFVQVNAMDTSAGLRVITSNANVMYGHFTIPDTTLANGVNLIDMYTNQFSINTQMFRVNGYGVIKSNDLVTGTELLGARRFLYSDWKGEIRKSDYDIADYLETKRLIRKLTAEEINTSYDSPITILENSDVDKVIIVDKVFLKYNYLTASFGWVNSAGLMVDGTNRFLFNVNLDLVTGTRTAYQQAHISFSDDSLYSYMLPGKDLLFKTLNANPYSGNGSIVLIIDYTLQNINI